jgi:hypothetical protein
LLAGCGQFEPERLEPVVGPAPLLDLRGALHVHSEHSKDARGSQADILAQARAVGLDFVLITDHNQRCESSDESDVLVVGGAEFGPEGHLLGIGQTKDLTSRQSRPQLADAIREAGGIAVAAHPCDPYQPFPRDALPLMDGMEIYSLSHDINDEGIPLYALKFLLFPFDRAGVLHSVVDVPDEPIAIFDQILAQKDFLGIGSTDAHGTHGLQHALAFTIVQTHVLAREHSSAGILEALRARRAYVSFEFLRPVRAFDFTIDGPSHGSIGSTVPFAPGLEITITVAPAAELRLVHDGVTAGRWPEAGEVHEPVRQPGVYRVEARTGGRVWILSNAIRVVAS